MRKMILGVILTTFVAAIPVDAFSAETIVTCKNPAGHANYHYAGILQEKDRGFVEDKITGGITTLIKIKENEYDILFVDTREKIISTKSDGGRVVLLRKGKNDATFLLMHPGMVITLYTFYRESDGRERFDMLSSKGGDGMPIHKSSVMTGNCSGLNLNLLHTSD